MANKDFRLDPHKITRKGIIRDDVSIFEDLDGLWVFFKGGNEVTITWSRVRAALKRKDKKWNV